MRGILGFGGYVPYRRLDRSTISAVAGAGGGKGWRSVASYDEDTTTMGVEAARILRRSGSAPDPAALYFATADPAYLDKTNATAIHAALRLDEGVVAADFGGAPRSAAAALRAALVGTEVSLVVSSDIRTGLPGGPDETSGGDAAAALLVGSDSDGPLTAELLGLVSATAEFLDRWRTPGSRRSQQWEERFGEGRYLPLGERAAQAALKEAGVAPGAVDTLVVSGTHGRAAASLARSLGIDRAPDLADSIGNAGTAQLGLLLCGVLEAAEPGRVVLAVSLADGADAFVLRTGAGLRTYRSARPIAAQIAAGGVVSYGRYLAWREMLPVEPPRRPEPARVSAAAAGRSVDWKFGFVGQRSTEDGTVTLPPGAGGGGDPAPMAEAIGTIAAATVDRLAYSPSPPVVFAVVDFDGGGRLPVELTDVDPDDAVPGRRVEMTFRRLSTADGIHNYFWKARPVRD